MNFEGTFVFTLDSTYLVTCLGLETWSQAVIYIAATLITRSGTILTTNRATVGVLFAALVEGCHVWFGATNCYWNEEDVEVFLATWIQLSGSSQLLEVVY
jgi:hypothetical protein